MSEFGKWEPIETAPKDGTEIMVYYPTWNGDDCVMLPAEWDKGREGMEEIEGTWFCVIYGHLGDGATHWQPLPPTPTE